MAEQMELALFDEIPDVEVLLQKSENQWFERKSFRIEPGALANTMIGLANADGGRIVVGIHNGRVEGINSSAKHLNELLQASIDFSSPPVRHAVSYAECMIKGIPDRLLIVDVEASEQLHRNIKQECYLRVGDETRQLSAIEERELIFDKGETSFDGVIVKELAQDDLDMKAIGNYGKQVHVGDPSRLMRSRGLYSALKGREGVTQAGWLLFGNETPIWSYVRYLRYAGTTVETGPRSNQTEDIRLEGAIPALIEQARLLIAEQVGSVIRLTESGRFERVPALPEFAWLEGIVNAVTHRSYSLQGDGVRVREFDDRVVIESPGRLPGLVRVQNIRSTRFSRNPRIARVLAEMGYVRELGEGVNRMFEEMSLYGLREPVYKSAAAGVHVTLYKQPDVARGPHERQLVETITEMRRGPDKTQITLLLSTLKEQNEISGRDLAQLLGVSVPTVRSYLTHLQNVGLVAIKRKSRTDPTTRWTITDSPFWSSDSDYLKPT